MILWTWEIGPYDKSNIFNLWRQDIFSLKPSRKTNWFSFHFIRTTALVKLLTILKETGCLPLLAGKSSDSTVSPNQSHNRNGILNPKNTLPWPFFSWHGTVCPRIVFTQLWNCRKTPFCDLWMETWWKKVVFSSSERWIVSALNLPEKYTGLFFPSLQQQLWSRF